MRPEQMRLLINVMDNVPDLTTFEFIEDEFSTGITFYYLDAVGNELEGKLSEDGAGGHVACRDENVSRLDKLKLMKELSGKFEMPSELVVEMIENKPNFIVGFTFRPRSLA